MRFSATIILGIQLSAVISLPTRTEHSDVETISIGLLTRENGHVTIAAPLKRASKESKEDNDDEEGEGEDKAVDVERAVASPATVPDAKLKEAAIEVGKATDATTGGEAAKPEEVNLTGAFGTAVALGAGDVKQDTLFTKSAVGAFEFEFQSKTADSLTVSENKTPAPPPAGFVAVEPSSFKVALTSKGVGLTLAKIDYQFDITNAAVKAMDLKQAKVGKLCTDTGSFIIEEGLGELEFEADENEISMKLNKAVLAEGEWGIFLPTAAAVAAPAAAPATTPSVTTVEIVIVPATDIQAVIDALRAGKPASPAFKPTA